MTVYTGFDLGLRATTLSAALELNISSVFTANTSTFAKTFALLFDAMLTTDDAKRVTLPSGLRYIRRVGTGLRIAICVSSFATDIKLSVSAVAAQTKLNMASSTYRVEGIGVSSDVLASYLKLPVTGSFDDTAFKLLRDALADTLPKYLESPDLGTGEYAVPISATDDDVVSQARGICYAAAAVAERKTLKDALAGKPDDITSEAVLVGYSRFAGSADPESNSAVSEAHADLASRWLSTGTFDS